MKFSFYTLTGVLLSFAFVVLGALDTAGVYKFPEVFLKGTALAIFVSLPSIMIVFGGVLLSSFVMFPFHQVVNALKKLIYIFSHSNAQKDMLVSFVNGLIHRLNLYKSNKEEFIKLISHKDSLEFEKFVVEMLETNYSKHDMSQMASARIELEHANDTVRADILGNMGASAPAFGMFGTVIGLVSMLRNLEDASNVGAALAVALITTLYGLIMSNFLFLPISRKIKEYANFELLKNQLIKEGYILYKENRSMLYISDSLYSKIGISNEQLS